MDTAKPLPEAFRFCPRCGTEADPVGQIPFDCPQCDFRFFFGPVTAVGGIVRDAHGDILLIRRARNPGKDQFGMPGGFVDQGENAEEALRREIWEEIGLVVDRLEYHLTLPNQYTYRGLTAAVLDIFFVVHVESFRDVVTNDAEVSQCWTGIPADEQLGQMAFESNRLALVTYLARSLGA